ncbi:cyanophycinase [Adhaeribacter sp. BT258]|uniref:Cyanophycinase n=1 Tax=Adhaeribacter terrigena TaxID=2793070 RepID=A0ABS1C5N1_9BACT|nr:cyanophycinase [Adhaeribacter terrigena]MBK0404695.1 cyanophycinase [Adhaeribacter terrigena]
MKNAKGKLIIIGGHEDKGNYETMSEEELQRKNIFLSEGVLKRIIKEINIDNPKIEVITSASLIPEEVGVMYQEAFKNLDVPDVGIMHIKNKEDANKQEFLDRLKQAHAVMISGGDQNRLVSFFIGSKALRIMQERYHDEENFLIAGTSAGAMCMSQVMIMGSFEEIPLIKGSVQTGTGLGFLYQMILDTHFIVRSRFSRLLEAVAAFPDHIGIGLGEDTAILVTGNNKVETIGSGMVVVIDGRELKKNNYAEILNGNHLSLQRIIVHVLPKGEIFEFKEANFY